LREFELPAPDRQKVAATCARIDGELRSVVRAALDQRARASQASTSSAVRGMAAERLSAPSAVTTMSSSMRTPMPRYS